MEILFKEKRERNQRRSREASLTLKPYKLKVSYDIFRADSSAHSITVAYEYTAHENAGYNKYTVRWGIVTNGWRLVYRWI